MIDYDKLKHLRNTKDISLIEMATALGFSTAGGYSRIETGENKLKAEQLPKIAKKFGITLEQLIKEIFFENKVDECSSSMEDQKEVG
ncbi:helix-turn-helix domain-containing protein [Paenibacillus sp. GXUN7292]|uniref:helix-turn-helix domain-containing protein n=1 Tax=Paenibacillus sp. GXUN7292 TaxID=3422499 RepID=UPI003D7C7B36